MELKSDLSNVKVGDRLFDITKLRWVTVKNINSHGDCPVVIEDFTAIINYMIDGKRYKNDLYPSLFTYNPFESKLFEPR